MNQEDSEARAAIYAPDPQLQIAAEVALELNMPLLLAGEPGTGKTSFADYLAKKMAPKWYGHEGRPLPLYVFEAKSTSVANDLFYRFDHLRRFHDSHHAGTAQSLQETRQYLDFEALGKAILFSQAWPEVADVLVSPAEHPGVSRAVVLIDEIDKAPRDFPNDILNEIERRSFSIPELRKDGSARKITANKELAPLIVLTSNNERNLPAAFLRRCVFHHIAFPDKALLAKIVQTNWLGDRRAQGRLVDEALEFFLQVRQLGSLDKAPGTAELVQWIKLLLQRQWADLPAKIAINVATSLPNASLRDLPQQQLQASMGVLAKTAQDLATVQTALHAHLQVSGKN